MIDGQPLACFQPFIDTATGRIAGVEALGRLLQADGQLLSVGPLFADTRTPTPALRRLDRTLRDNALSRLHEAPEDWFLSLNISPRWITLLRPGQPLPSLKQLQAHGVDPKRIVFEITELGGNSQRLAEVVARYREAGARIAIDDFGAGYSQLDRVLALRPDILKLDMRLFQAAALGGPSGEVVRALAQMAEKTGCWIIAEGVETEAQLRFALECGARYVQGYLFAQAQLDWFASDAFVPRFRRTAPGLCPAETGRAWADHAAAPATDRADADPARLGTGPRTAYAIATAAGLSPVTAVLSVRSPWHPTDPQL